MRKLFLAILMATFNSAYAQLELNLSAIAKEEYSRHEYFDLLLRAVLSKTKNTHGDFKINYITRSSRNRALKELVNGRLTVYDAPTRKEWEEKSTAIYIPLVKGLLGYRLLLIRKEDQKLFSKIKNLEDLKKLHAGVGKQWSTTKILKHLKIPYVAGNSYEGLFDMLMFKRFDYFIRGVNEIYGEWEFQKKTRSNLHIEETLCLVIPMPVYFFVSPKYPKVAERIEIGLKMMIKDGSFDKLFMKYHESFIEKAQFSKRNIITIGNPLLRQNPIYNNKSMWLKLK